MTIGADQTAGQPRETGQALILAVLAMAVLFGFAAMAIDVGLLFEDRREYQNSADAMALAGVAELPLNPLAAKQKATQWAALNGIDSAEIKSIEVRTTKALNDTLFVELEGQYSWSFGRVLGQTESNVGAQAAARTGSLSGGHNMMPWSIIQGDSSCLDALGKPLFSATCSVKVGAQSKFGGGWRGALDFDGNGGGASEYKDNIVDGTSETMYCIESQLEPPCETATVDIKSGNVVGPTAQGIQEHLAPGPQCDANGNGKDDFNEVFTPTGKISPAYSVSCPNSPWLIIVPIVKYDGGQTVTIKGWTLGYFLSYACVPNPSCKGNGHMEVQIKIADATYSQSTGFLGAYDPTSGILLRRLVQ